MSQTINVNVTIPGGGSVDPLRVPQYLSAAESTALGLIFTTAAPPSVNPGSQFGVPFDTIQNIDESTGAANDYLGLLTDTDDIGPVAVIQFKKPGIYRAVAYGNFADDASGTYRATEFYPYSEVYGHPEFDLASQDAPAWESTMGYVASNLDGFVVAPGHTTSVGARAYSYVYVAHDADTALVTSIVVRVRPLAVFESLD